MKTKMIIRVLLKNGKIVNRAVSHTSEMTQGSHAESKAGTSYSFAYWDADEAIWVRD